jgi:hypothetical protein
MNSSERITQEEINKTRVAVEAHMKRVERNCLKTTRTMLVFALLQCALPILLVITLYELDARFHLVQALCFGVLVAIAVNAVRKYEYSRLLYLKVRNRDF